MSYIRAGSNPEGLYIWGDGEGTLTISFGMHCLHIPRDTFHGILKAWKENDFETEVYPKDGGLIRDYVEFGEATFKQVWVDGPKLTLRCNSWPPGEEVIAYETTWHYLLQGVLRREEEDA